MTAEERKIFDALPINGRFSDEIVNEILSAIREAEQEAYARGIAEERYACVQISLDQRLRQDLDSVTCDVIANEIRQRRDNAK